MDRGNGRRLQALRTGQPLYTLPHHASCGSLAAHRRPARHDGSDIVSQRMRLVGYQRVSYYTLPHHASCGSLAAHRGPARHDGSDIVSQRMRLVGYQRVSY